MEAIVVEKTGGPGVLQVKKVDIPKPGENEVLIRIKAAGINPVDTYIREKPESFGLTPPYTPGFDGAGIVESVGGGVLHLKKGDRVFTSCHSARKGGGTYAQYGVFRENGVFLLPDNVDFATGAALGIPHFTAYQALVLIANAKPTDTVLIHGASGAVGQAAIQVCRSLGIKTVVGTAGTDQGLEIVKQLGATNVYNHRDKKHAEQILKEVGGMNIIIEMSANNNLESDLDLIADFGMIVVVGGPGQVEITPEKLLHKSSTIKGVILLKATEDEWKTMGAKIVEGLKNDTYTTRIAQSFPLGDAKKAHEEQEKSVHGGGAAGNFVLLID